VPSTPFMTLAQLKIEFAKWAVDYLTRAHDGLFEIDTGRKRSPAQVAAERVRAPMMPSKETLAVVAWPRAERVAQRGFVEIEHRKYKALELLRIDGERVDCHLDPHDASSVVIFRAGKFFCEATEPELVSYKAVLGSPVERATLAAAERAKRDAEKKLREGRNERIAAELALAAPPAPLPEPPTVASTSDQTPVDAVLKIVPSTTELVRAARARGAAKPEIDPRTADEIDEAKVIAAIGERPVEKEFASDTERARERKEIDFWEKTHAHLLAVERAKRTAKQGGPQ